jgi:capsular polysaccharide biosynthesis protein
MVATQNFSVSRRTLDVEDYIDVVRRHAGWILGPAFFGLVASICVAFTMQNKYQSTAIMQITPAQISDTMVQSTIANSLTERIEQMQTSILSHNGLSQIINDPRLHLYKDEIKNAPLDDVIEQMKSNIHIEFINRPGALDRHATAFTISFTYPDRFLAQQTVSALMNKFDEQNQSTQKTDQDAVTGLVGDLMQKAKADLADANDKLTQFREGNVGKLPEQVQTNIARENSYTEKIRATNEQIYRDQQEIARLETQRTTAKGQLSFYDEEQLALESAMTPGSPAAIQNQELAQLELLIKNEDYNVKELQKHYSEKYRPLQDAETHLAMLKSRREDTLKEIAAKQEAAAKAGLDAAQSKKVTPSIREMQVRHQVDDTIRSIDAQEKLINADIDKAKAELTIYNRESNEVSQLLKDSTGVVATYEDLIQTKNLAQQRVEELEKKNELASANRQLVERKVSENLEVLDNATLPSSPISPKHGLIVASGFAMSLVLGLGLAGLQEAKDTSLKNLKDVRAYTNLPVLCSIPLLENTMLVKRKKRLTYLAWAAAVVVGIAAVAGAIAYYNLVTLKGGA